MLVSTREIMATPRRIECGEDASLEIVDDGGVRALVVAFGSRLDEACAVKSEL